MGGPEPHAPSAFQSLGVQLRVYAAEERIPLLTHVVQDGAPEAISAFAKEHDFDLVVVAPTGGTQIGGSTAGWEIAAARLAGLVRCPVLFVK
jgi:hypothetical protein